MQGKGGGASLGGGRSAGGGAWREELREHGREAPWRPAPTCWEQEPLILATRHQSGVCCQSCEFRFVGRNETEVRVEQHGPPASHFSVSLAGEQASALLPRTLGNSRKATAQASGQLASRFTRSASLTTHCSDQGVKPVFVPGFFTQPIGTKNVSATVISFVGQLLS